jgi:hypothetical protein
MMEGIDGKYKYVSGEGNIIQYINWQTPIVRLNGSVDAGVYAGNVYWADRVSETFEELGGNLLTYDAVVALTDPETITKLTGKTLDSLPEFSFVAEFQPADRQDLYVDPNTPINDRTSIIAHRV